MIIAVQDIPHINAILNSISVVFLLFGYYFIRVRDKSLHKLCMIGASIVSALFLIGYVYYKLNTGFAKFGGEGAIRIFYFSFLFVHVVGAFAITPLVPMTLYRALTGNFDRHKKLARWTWPLWVYVGVSGVIIYFMAIHLYPHVPG
jgi:putative membrane protein